MNHEIYIKSVTNNQISFYFLHNGMLRANGVLADRYQRFE